MTSTCLNIIFRNRQKVDSKIFWILSYKGINVKQLSFQKEPNKRNRSAS